eukprot:gene13117-17581_t
MFASIVSICFFSVASALVSNNGGRIVNTALNVRSKSVPFLEQQPALTGKLPGDVGFDPLGLTALWGDKDWAQQVVPEFWPEKTTTKVTTVEWMREAELKHCRLAMLAVVGWVAVDLGVRFPGESFAAIPNSLSAHTAAVENGSMGLLLNVVSALELASGAAIYDQAKGSGRPSGDFSFDPLGLGKDPKKKERYATSEIKNGRLAMFAISGLVTQAALFPDQSFPYF